MNNLDRNYQQLLKDIIEYGVTKKDRTGTGTKSIFGYTIRHSMAEGFPLLTTKKMAWKTLVTELLWFLKGDTNIKYLDDNGCNIWNGDAYKNYTSHFTGYEDVPNQEWFVNEIKTNNKFAKKWGELGPVYGRMWRAFDEDSYGGIDQIANLINDLKTNPDSRRLMVTAWHPGYNQHSVLPPCHYGFQVYTRELSMEERMAEYEKRGYIKNIDPLDWVPSRAISLMWNQRSVDTFLGLPFNIASYGLLLEMLAKEVNMIPDQLIGNLGDVHLYSNHIEQAKEQIERRPMKLPSIEIGELDILKGSAEIELKNYLHHSAIKAPLSN